MTSKLINNTLPREHIYTWSWHHIIHWFNSNTWWRTNRFCNIWQNTSTGYLSPRTSDMAAFHSFSSLDKECTACDAKNTIHILLVKFNPTWLINCKSMTKEINPAHQTYKLSVYLPTQRKTEQTTKTYWCNQLSFLLVKLAYNIIQLDWGFCWYTTVICPPFSRTLIGSSRAYQTGNLSNLRIYKNKGNLYLHPMIIENEDCKENRKKKLYKKDSRTKVASNNEEQ